MLLDKVGKELLLFDGAMGSQIQAAGYARHELPEVLNISNPELIIGIHQAYIEAGASIVSTNTFGCNAYKLKDSGYTVEEIVIQAVAHVREAIKRSGKQAYIALDVGPIGQMLAPVGELSFDEAYSMYQSVIASVKDQVDCILFETMSDLYEVKAAILAAKETCNVPVFVSMTFEANGRTLSGSDPISFVNVVEGLGVTALGVNCSLGPVELTPIVEKLLQEATIPVFVQANAGIPYIENEQTIYPTSITTYTECMQYFVSKGCSMIGGCCGTTPAFIADLKMQLSTTVHPRDVIKKTRISSATQTITIANQLLVCGERLNPTGKKKMKEALLRADYDEIVKEAIIQEQAFAHFLDVNVGVPGIDETTVLCEVIKRIQEVISLPLQIDSSSIEAIEKACRYYNGKPMINSVNGKPEVMDAIFKIAHKYGAVIIGLTLDETIPLSASERVVIAERIVDTAKRYNISKADIVIDCLTLTASAQQKEVQETLLALTMLKEKQIPTILGVSNVSFGLPNRGLLNRTFLTLAMQAGLNIAIINPLDKQLMETIDAYHVLSNRDTDAKNYIAKQVHSEAVVIQTNPSFKLADTIRLGLKDEVENACKLEVQASDAYSVINTIIIPTLKQVGEAFERNELFLPQLIQSAESAKIAFQYLQTFFVKDVASKGTVILATVEGDIHDIGKNIVKVIVESYGFEVIDLGKNVPIHVVVEAYQQHQPLAIGLSALMTTTVVSMRKTIEALHEIKITCPILVGGAVLSEDIANDIHADYYCKDAMEAVHVLNKLQESID